MACPFFTRLLGLILFIIPTTLASVYITQPWAATVWTTFQCETLSWRYDSGHPHLPHMGGPAVADLYTEAGIYTASVKIDDIKSGTMKVCLPDPCRFEYRSWRYEIRIIANGITYYSHPFTIKNISCSTNTFVVAESDAALSDPTTESGSSENLHQSPVSPATIANPSAGVPQNKLSVPMASTVSAAPSNQPASFGLQSHVNSASNRFTKSRHWLHSEKIKFHLVFIVWPALVGISMAL